MTAQDPRLVHLESQYAFLEQTVESLNDVILEQGQLLERLQGRLRELETRIAAKHDGGGPGESDPLEERPPHY